MKHQLSPGDEVAVGGERATVISRTGSTLQLDRAGHIEQRRAGEPQLIASMAQLVRRAMDELDGQARLPEPLAPQLPDRWILSCETSGDETAATLTSPVGKLAATRVIAPDTSLRLQAVYRDIAQQLRLKFAHDMPMVRS